MTYGLLMYKGHSICLVTSYSSAKIWPQLKNDSMYCTSTYVHMFDAVGTQILKLRTSRRRICMNT
jgi:hypothetical protein